MPGRYLSRVTAAIHKCASDLRASAGIDRRLRRSSTPCVLLRRAHAPMHYEPLKVIVQ